MRLKNALVFIVFGMIAGFFTIAAAGPFSKAKSNSSTGPVQETTGSPAATQETTISTVPVQQTTLPSAPGVYALIGSNYVSMTAPAIDRDMGLAFFGQSSPKFIISGKSAAVQCNTNLPSFVIVLSQPEFKGKYDDPHTWDILLAYQKSDHRELPMKKGTKYSIGESDCLPTVEKVTPLVYKLTAATGLSDGEYFLLTGYNEKTKLPTGYDFGIVKK